MQEELLRRGAIATLADMDQLEIEHKKRREHIFKAFPDLQQKPRLSAAVRKRISQKQKANWAAKRAAKEAKKKKE